MSGQQHVSLEPLPIFANDGQDSDLFAKPPRLEDVNLTDGSEVFTRSDTKKSLQERLMKVWAERGDYSEVTEETIRNPIVKTDDADKVEQDAQGRPSPEEMRTFAENMLNNLTIARGELSTALDLLNVLSPATDPPNVDVNTIPLPHETLTLVPTSIPPPPSFTDPSQNPLAALPLAESLESLKTNAKLIFRASEDLIPLDENDEMEDSNTTVHDTDNEGAGNRVNLEKSSTTTPRKRISTKSPDPWPTILSLHSSSPSRSLIPLGAMSGATLTGKNENRSARQIGVFYGFEEAARDFRRASVAGIRELVSEDVERGGGRRLCIEMCEVGAGGRVETEIWGDREHEEDGRDERDQSGGVEAILERRNRSAFAEELFAKLVNEAKHDANLGAQYKVGNMTRGDSVELKPVGGWQLKISMISPTSKISLTDPANRPSSRPISLISPLLRLLFLREYSSRRERPTSRTSATTPSRPLLATISTFLQYLERVSLLRTILLRTRSVVKGDAAQDVDDLHDQVGFEFELWSGEKRLSIPEEEKEDGASGREKGRHVLREMSTDVVKVIKGEDTELGGRALIRLNKRHAFHISFSLPLPTAADASTSTTSFSSNTGSKRQPLLTLRSPGKVQPVVIPSMRHLENFLAGEVKRVLSK